MKKQANCRQIVVLGVFLPILYLAPASSSAEPYFWPLEESKNVTSGFGAHRDAHYHGGLDISTGGKEGLPVRAADSGYVFRLSTSYWGYGKAVYLKLTDGRIAVYGHLSQFSAAIRDYVENQQYARKRYSTNLFPLPDELPVDRGDIIGYTGQSGYGPPHLHFEIRTGNNYPLNPLALDVGYQDRIQPRFRGVVVRPLLSVDPEARVDGGLSPIYLKAEKAGRPGHYVIKDRVIVNGAIGLGVDCSDPTGYKKYDISPYRFSVTVNDLRFFEITYDSLDFALTRQVDLDYDFDWLAVTGDEVRNLYRPPGSALTWYDEGMGDGILDCRRPEGAPVSGENHIEISAFDAAGNESVLKMTVLFDSPPRLTGLQSELEPQKKKTIPVICDFAPGGLIVRSPVAGSSVSYLQAAAQIRTIEQSPGKWEFFVDVPRFLDINSSGFGGRFILRGDQLGIEGIAGSEGNNPSANVLIWPPGLVAVSPETGNDVYSEDSLSRARFYAGDLYNAAFFRIRPYVYPRDLKPQPTSKLYSFEPISVPFARKVEVGISYQDLPASVDDLALYALENDRKSWKFLARDVDATTKFMTARVWSFGPYALIADTKPPQISRVIPGKGSKTSHRRPEITFKIVDDLSGIGSDSDIEILLDGAWLIPEYDPETYRGRTRPRQNLAPGKHKLEIRARDRVGHEDFFLRYFTVVKRKG